MVRLDLATVLLAVTAVARAVTPSTPSIVPGAYIVEYEEDQDSNAFVSNLGGKASLRKDLRFKLFKGASIQFKDTKNADRMIAKVATMPKIKGVYPVRRYPVPHHVVHSTGSDAVEAVLAKRQEEGNDTFTTHLMTQVNKFRDSGVTGKGVKIGIIDTGTDYLHPALGGCFGEGCLVSYGTDLVGDDFNGGNTPTPDADPLDNCNGHGTHVAGIIAAQADNPYGIIGAAQDVTLGSYRVFGCTGDVGNDILIAAYNMAYEDGSDIITASIGGASGWSEDPWAAVVSRIVENGVPCVVSAGNDGAAGIFYASTAANGKKVTAIASVDNTATPALLSNASFAINGTSDFFGYTAGEPGVWDDVRLPLWSVGFDTSDPANGCEPYPESTPDLSGYIVLVRRGTCAFVDKAAYAAEKGAKYVIFYNNVDGTVSVAASVEGITGVAMVTPQQGETWVRALEAGSEVVVHITDPLKAGSFLSYSENALTGGFLSDFTSWGPTYELEVKPQFSAPGGLILSTYPRALGSYGVLSGTSMACPMAAAVYALLINSRGTKDPKTLENLLSATARPNVFRLQGRSLPVLAPVAQQGAGLLQAWDAAHATTLLSVSSLSFNDTDNFSPVQNFSISNTGEKAVTYSLSNIGAATAYTFSDETSISPSAFPNELTADFASLAFSPNNFTIPAGQRKIITVTATAPKGVNVKRLPVYSGYIAINGSDSSALSLPYLGVAGSMHSAVVLDPQGARVSASRDQSNSPVPANSTFVLPPRGFSNDPSYGNRTELPKLVVMLAMGSAVLRADVVPLSNCTAAARVAGTVFGTKTIGQPEGLPALWNPRGRFEYRWDGKLDDGTYAPAGRYRFAVKALRIFGDRDVATEYDAAETVDFRIQYLPDPLGKVRRQDEGC
ncbi:peptidase S8/S53 domain-containing protein [Chaetomium fimeti]|jgi:subtilisin family serine protease|uniref:Peptidase S8/S53 domain-containing protein n=1 Tax=Chaetomium fimeti TaxID=1854472 RepID=A0AAE0HFG5_9PEZI|nr:peptidase S8/S53 domain-containing protein [Chaetomium fimeti]